MAKKSDRIITALLCKVCNSQNYVSQRNKTNDPKIELEKYCGHCRKKTEHKSKDKLK